VGSKLYLGFHYDFEYNGRAYRWSEKARRGKRRNHEILIDKETREVIAKFDNSSILQLWKQKTYGKLVVYNEDCKSDDKFLDVVVTTLVAVKQRIREKKRMRAFWKLLAAAGDGAGGN